LSDDIPKIGGFGNSQIEGTETEQFNTGIERCNWMAPEMLESNPSCTEKVDIWSFGMVLYELATNTVPYHYLRGNIVSILREVCVNKKTPPLPEGQVIEPTLHSLMQQCWNWNPQQRPSFSQIVQTLKNAMNRK
jgi:serine/threonine protein kinase